MADKFIAKDYLNTQLHNMKTVVLDEAYASKDDVSKLFKYKGSVANRAALPTTNIAEGDVYNLEDTGMNVVYVVPEAPADPFWDDFGATFTIEAEDSNIDFSAWT